MNTLKHIPLGIKTGFILLISVILMQSCLKDTVDFDKISKKVELDPKLVIPLLKDDVTLKEILKAADDQGMVKEYGDGLYYLVYETDASSDNAEDVMQIPAQPPITKTFTSTQVIPPVGISAVTKDSTYISFAVNNTDALDSVWFKSGTISLNVNSTFPNDGSLVITIDSLRRNNIPLTINVGNIKSGAVSPIDLTGYNLYLKKRGGLPNQIKVRYTLTLQASGTAIQPGNRIDITTQVSQPRFSAMFGFISSYTLFNFVDRDIKLDIFELDQNAVVQFADPRVKVYFSNTFGIPVTFGISNFRTHADGSDTTYNLAISPAYNPFSPAYPMNFANFKPALDTLDLNISSIPNLDKAIATVPQDVYFNAIGTINSTGIQKSFVLDSSRLDAKVVMELPFHLRAGTFEVIDTINDLDLSTGIEDFSALDSIKILNTVENHIPFEVRCQIYFTDSLYNKVDSLYTPANQPVVPSGTLNSDGKVISAASKTLISVLTGTRIKNLEKVRKGLVKIHIATTNGGSQFVKFYNTDNIKMKMGMQVNFKIRSLDQFK